MQRVRKVGVLWLLSLGVGMLGVCASVLPAAAARPKGAPATLKVGIVSFLSGPASSPFGIPSRNAARLWIDKLNQEGGIGGAKLVPVFIDEAGGTARQVTEFRRLVLDEKVNFVLGYISSADCLGIAPVAEELQTLTILADCGTVRVFEARKYHYVFRTHAHTVIDGVGAARYVLRIKPALKTVAGINQELSLIHI